MRLCNFSPFKKGFLCSFILLMSLYEWFPECVFWSIKPAVLRRHHFMANGESALHFLTTGWRSNTVMDELQLQMLASEGECLPQCSFPNCSKGRHLQAEEDLMQHVRCWMVMAGRVADLHHSVGDLETLPRRSPAEPEGEDGGGGALWLLTPCFPGSD